MTAVELAVYVWFLILGLAFGWTLAEVCKAVARARADR